MEELRKQNERMTKQVGDLTIENRKLIDPLKQAQADVKEYKRMLVNYERDKASLTVIFIIHLFTFFMTLKNRRTQKQY